MKRHSYLKIVALFSVLTSFSVQAYQLSGYKWGASAPGTGALLTWGYAENNSNCRVDPSNCAPGSANNLSRTMLPGGFRQIDDEVRSAFNVWENYADVDFVFTNNNPDILIGQHSIDNTFGILAQTTTSYFTVANNLGSGFQSDIAFDADDNFKLNPDDSTGSFFFNVIAHEIGHTLGLSHAEDENSLMFGSLSDGFVGPQADDIAGIQFLYGADTKPIAIQSLNGNLQSDLSEITAVPIPAAFWLMVSGFGVVTAMRKRIL